MWQTILCCFCLTTSKIILYASLVQPGYYTIKGMSTLKTTLYILIHSENHTAQACAPWKTIQFRLAQPKNHTLQSFPTQPKNCIIYTSLSRLKIILFKLVHTKNFTVQACPPSKIYNSGFFSFKNLLYKLFQPKNHTVQTNLPWKPC